MSGKDELNGPPDTQDRSSNASAEHVVARHGAPRIVVSDSVSCHSLCFAPTLDHQQPHHRAGTAGSLAVKVLQQRLQLALTCQIARPRAGYPPEQYQVGAQENQDTRQGRPVEFTPRHVIDPMASDGDG